MLDLVLDKSEILSKLELLNKLKNVSGRVLQPTADYTRM
jgi:hypothetical protein